MLNPHYLSQRSPEDVLDDLLTKAHPEPLGEVSPLLLRIQDKELRAALVGAILQFVTRSERNAFRLGFDAARNPAPWILGDGGGHSENAI